MQVNPERLSGQLARGLAALYAVFGEEPLQIRECLDAVRGAALRAGYAERRLFEPDGDPDWGEVRAESLSLSLFASRRLIEVRLRDGRLGESGARALTEYAAAPPADVLLLLSLGKLDARQRSSAWLQALDRAGVVVSVRTPGPDELPAWVQRRAGQQGLTMTGEAVRALAERSEGNLLACAQELEKLALLHPGATVDVREVVACAADSARYDVFDLVESALAGDSRRAVRVLAGLRSEGTEPPLLVWALSRELRGLEQMAAAAASGEPVARVLGRFRVWESRKNGVRRALARLRPGQLLGLVQWLARVDRMVKGLLPGDAWDELSRLTLALSGGERQAAA
jgi:DNA polymerase-3 subunit delta